MAAIGQRSEPSARPMHNAWKMFDCPWHLYHLLYYAAGQKALYLKFSCFDFPWLHKKATKATHTHTTQKNLEFIFLKFIFYKECVHRKYL